MDIRAAVSRGKSLELSMETVRLAAPREDEILVRLVATGVCHTDLKVCQEGIRVPRPVVLGHEGSGVVERVGSGVAKVRSGDHVVMTFNFCGACPSCLEGAVTYCHEAHPRNFGGSRPDGSSPLSRDGELIHGNFFGQSSFASFAICNERNVVKVRNDLPLELLGPLGCGIQTGAGAVINALRVAAGRSIAIFGTGAVGLSAVMAARLVGASKIIAVDLLQPRLSLAMELGATHAVNAGSEDAREAILRYTGHGADFAIDTTTVTQVIQQAIRSLAPRGTCAVMASGNAQQEVCFNVIHLLSGGRTVRGIIEGDSTPDVFIPLLADLQAQGRFPFDRLVRYYPFERINDAIADAHAGRTIKPILRF